MFKYESLCPFCYMNIEPKLPSHVRDAFHEFQINHGGEFHRFTKLHPKTYSAVVYAFDSVNSDVHRTRFMALKPGFILVHYSEFFREELTILRMFDRGYGHLFYPGHHRSQLENICGKTFVLEPNSANSHGIALLNGYLIVKSEIYGEYSPEDLKY